MIYAISNPAKKTANYVCPDQASLHTGKILYPNAIFSVGGKSEADAIAEQNRTAWLAENISLFSVNKDINPDPIDTTWLVCDLETEPENNDVDYNVFNGINGYYTLATGLDNAKALLEEAKTNAMNFVIFVYELDAWDLHKGLSEGVQDL